ncbi:acetyltransferase [Clohesyomyces aquaticus]|uniref:Acetyltransferase n=1 Tax=Clohesyomyces aquaticus TaxID=1231657 RepID=A0A1Y1ZIN4_9PLEO|nr:acetyltransferase [Clohesyomyces aquaticus]
MSTIGSGILTTPAKFPDDHTLVSCLFTAYAESLEIDLAFQNFAQELSSLPGKYAPENGGALLLARSPPQIASADTSQPQTPIGCVALRAFAPPRICELKRLYIVPDARGLGAGRKLLEAVIGKAREMGYKKILLDTLPSMVAARKMYAAFGFEEVEKYYESPIEGTCFMRLRLD